MAKQAHVRIDMLVTFADSGEDDLISQAIESAADVLGLTAFLFVDEVQSVEVIGGVVSATPTSGGE